MTLREYLVGVAVFVATWGAVGASAAMLLRRRFGHLRGAARAVAVALLFLAGLVAVHLVAAGLGILSRASVLVVAAVGAVAIWRLVAPAGREPEAVPAPRCPSSRVSWALAALAVGAVATDLLAYLPQAAGLASTGSDFMLYHLPIAVRWMQSGGIWQEAQLVPYYSVGTYPHTGEVVFLAAVLPFGRDAFVHLVGYPLVVLVGLTVYATGRELRAPAATAALFGALAVSTPAILVPALDLKVDAVMLSAYGAGMLFLARHRRTRATGDLVLGAVGAGLAFGSSPTGAVAVIAGLVVWALASWVGRRRAGDVLREVAVVAGIVAATGGIWALRNLIVTGNPVFPVKVALGAVTLFDAPMDLVTKRYGVTVGHYATDPDALRRLVLPEYRRRVALPGVVAVLGTLMAIGLALAGRLRASPRARAGSAVAVAVAAVAVFAAYLRVPYGAAGVEGQPWPGIIGANVRWAMPAMLAAAAASAWAVGQLRRSRVAFELLAAAATVDGLLHGVALPPVKLLAAGALVLAAGAVAWIAVTRPGVRSLAPTRVAVAAVVAAGVAIALAAGYVEQRRFERHRYRGLDPTSDWVLLHAPRRARIGVAGRFVSAPVAPLLGDRLENRVSYVGPLVAGLRREYTRPSDYRGALRRGRYDLVLVGRGVVPRPGGSVERWTASAGYRLVAQSPGWALFRRARPG